MTGALPLTVLERKIDDWIAAAGGYAWRARGSAWRASPSGLANDQAMPRRTPTACEWIDRVRAIYDAFRHAKRAARLEDRIAFQVDVLRPADVRRLGARPFRSRAAPSRSRVETSRRATTPAFRLDIREVER